MGVSAAGRLRRPDIWRSKGRPIACIGGLPGWRVPKNGRSRFRPLLPSRRCKRGRWALGREASHALAAREIFRHVPAALRGGRVANLLACRFVGRIGAHELRRRTFHRVVDFGESRDHRLDGDSWQGGGRQRNEREQEPAHPFGRLEHQGLGGLDLGGFAFPVQQSVMCP